MGGIVLIFDEAVDDGAFADCLVAYEHYFEFDGVFLMGGVRKVFLELVAH